MIALGFDTSNYTTSIAYYDGMNGMNCSQLLPVKHGQLGLRQSDAVFHHTQSLPELSGRLFSNVSPSEISSVGVSTRPRAVDGSYMPCFTVGISHAKLIADALHVPLNKFSHQQGHVAACLWSANRMDLMDTPHLAWHLSGGTTELLLVEPDGKSVSCKKIGGTSDISAGQLIDRTAQLLGLGFPGGKQLDLLSQESCSNDFFRVKCHDMTFSFSGVENKAHQYFEQNANPCETAGYVLRSICTAVVDTTRQAIKEYPGLEIVFSGGVSSNALLRSLTAPLKPVFSQPAYSTDNAMGIAILSHRVEVV